MRRLTPVLALGALLCSALPAQAADAGPAHRESFGTRAPYAAGQNPHGYQRPPAGFAPVFTENVSRHGSRAATGSEDGDLILALWDAAEEEHQLTRKGEEFGLAVRALQDAMAEVGYGNLSGRGRHEMRDTALRMARRVPSLFATIADEREKIDVVSSGQGRAVDSAAEFAGALAEADPALKPLIGPVRTDENLLYFHKAAGGAAYRDYIAGDQRLKDTLHAITEQPRTHEAARGVLRRIFTKAFVDGIGDQVRAARAVYNLYAIAPAMSEESPGGKGWGMERYISRSDAAWFGYLSDAQEFYEKGPGFSGSDITYRMADVLLDDFFRQAEARRDGTGDLGAELRFTHAEEIIPLAALMRLPGSTRPADPDRPYTYAGNPWRGADVSPLGANVQWDLFRKGDRYLVRMLYDEQETAFKAGCRPIARGSAFYDLDELERCFGRD